MTTIEQTTGIAYSGTRGLLVTVTGAPSQKGYAALGIIHDLTGLGSGMAVTLHLRVPGEEPGGVQFFAVSSASKSVWAPEMRYTNEPLPDHAGWSTVRWTISPVDRLHGIGMQIYSEPTRRWSPASSSAGAAWSAGGSDMVRTWSRPVPFGGRRAQHCRQRRQP